MSRTHSHTYGIRTTHHNSKKIKYNRARDKRESFESASKFKPIRPTDNKIVYRDAGSYKYRQGAHNVHLNGYIQNLLVKFCDKKYSEFKRIALMKAKNFGAGITDHRMEEEIFYTMVQNAEWPSYRKKLQFFRRKEDGAVLLSMKSRFFSSESICEPLFYGKYTWRVYSWRNPRTNETVDSYYIDKNGFIRKQTFIFENALSFFRTSHQFDDSWEACL